MTTPEPEGGEKREWRTFCRFGCYEGTEKGRCPECGAVLLYETASHEANPYQDEIDDPT